MSYTIVKNSLDEIAERSTVNSKRVDQAKQYVTAAQNDLVAMQSAYTAILSEIETEAAANPTDAAWQAAQAEKDQLVADFQALKTQVDALATAIGV